MGKGCPSYCWCGPYRYAQAEKMSKAEKRDAIIARAKEGTPIGVLAYDGGEPVGWCSIAPRETYEKLERSTVMPDLGEEAVWTIMCFFVRRDHRRRGLSHALLEGALGYARKGKAHVVEAYPYDTGGITATHMGHSSLYRSAGFRPDEGRRWVKRFVR